MQTPFGGCPLATEWVIAKKSIRQHITKSLGTMLWGLDVNTIKELSYLSLTEFWRNRENDFKDFKIPVVCLATYCTKGHFGPYDTYYKHIKKLYDVESDGLVPVKDQILPSSIYVNLGGVNHGGTVWSKSLCCSKYKAPDIAESLLHLLFSQVKTDSE
eukprot:TRINITY_DN6602_c0_g3_i1.p1 TRINITY_DN6602_c0_g3~~TRINITY_DN6602_c0_g3_i1.p1  ORF type:complete len:158 (-),score=18.36 TRINITY_DN6602_c0_g3_i1:170-643(-)